MDENRKYHFDTLSIHAAEQADQHQALNAPIYMTSTFTFTDLQQAEDTFNFKRRAYVYTRGGNPTVNLFEQRLATLENGVDGVAFASGMAAISSTILSLATAGETVLAHRNLYGSTFGFLNRLITRYGLKSEFIDMTDLELVERSITPRTKIVYLETPTNPALEIIDIEKLCQLAHAKSIKVVVDNTFATPVFQRPLDLGADVVLHSVTKYISGHGDVVGGFATSKDLDYVQRLKFAYMCELGGVMSPFNAWLLLRGMKTLGLRMEKHTQNATAIARFLESRPEIEKVLYPGLSDHPGHELAARQMSGFGGIVSFQLRGERETAREFVSHLKLIKLAVSLGDAETLVEVPAVMTHRDYPEEELHKFGFSGKTVRISAGLEHPTDLINDIQASLEKVF